MSLYLAPRIRKKKIHMTKEDLLDELPNIDDLKPWPSKNVLNISHGIGLVTCSALSPDDLHIASGNANG